MADNRLSRELETREQSKRKAAWAPPTLLPEPNPLPGWKFKYVRISTMGQADPTNASRMLREGWEPVKAADVPEIMHFADSNPTSRFKDCVEIGGLLLCKAPEEMVTARREYYDKMNRAQMEGVDNNFMREKDAKSNMQMFADRKSDVSFGRGNRS